MRISKLCLCLLFIIVSTSHTEAQLFKRLKDRINRTAERKVEDKVVQKTEEAIDGVFEPKNKGEKPSTNNDRPAESTDGKITEQSFGDAQVNSPGYDPISVSDVGQTKVEISEDKTSVFGSWWTHEADIPDGYRLDIFNALDKEGDFPQYFNIPDDASLKISYDPSMPVKKGSGAAVTDAYLSQQLPTGRIKVTAFNDQMIQIELENGGDFAFGIKTRSPQFIDNYIPVAQSSTKENQSTASDLSITPPSAEARSTYEFTYEILTDVTIMDDGENQKMKMSYLLNPDQEYMGIKTNLGDFEGGDVQGLSFMIMDNGDSHIFVESSGMKMQISAGMAQQSASPTDQLNNYDYSKLQKTGNTKKILGYDCYEYTMQSEDYDAKFWAAPDFDLPNWMMANMPAEVESPLEGYIMEFWVKHSEGTMTSKVIDINKEADVSINSGDYKKMF